MKKHVDLLCELVFRNILVAGCAHFLAASILVKESIRKGVVVRSLPTWAFIPLQMSLGNHTSNTQIVFSEFRDVEVESWRSNA